MGRSERTANVYSPSLHVSLCFTAFVGERKKKNVQKLPRSFSIVEAQPPSLTWTHPNGVGTARWARNFLHVLCVNIIEKTNSPHRRVTGLNGLVKPRIYIQETGVMSRKKPKVNTDLFLHSYVNSVGKLASKFSR